MSKRPVFILFVPKFGFLTTESPLSKWIEWGENHLVLLKKDVHYLQLQNGAKRNPDRNRMSKSRISITNRKENEVIATK
jgi:hypothetical protein